MLKTDTGETTTLWIWHLRKRSPSVTSFRGQRSVQRAAAGSRPALPVSPRCSAPRDSQVSPVTLCSPCLSCGAARAHVTASRHSVTSQRHVTASRGSAESAARKTLHASALPSGTAARHPEEPASSADWQLRREALIGQGS
jgi:hypothetical protein